MVGCSVYDLFFELVFPLLYFQALDLTLAKDERLAVGFFQRSAVMMQIDRHEAAQTKVHWFISFSLSCFLISVHSVFLCLQTRGGSLRLYLGAEAHARKRSHRLQAVGASLQTEQLAGHHHRKHSTAPFCLLLYQSSEGSLSLPRVKKKKKKTCAMQVKCHRHLQANKASLMVCVEESHTNHSSADSYNCTACLS